MSDFVSDDAGEEEVGIPRPRIGQPANPIGKHPRSRQLRGVLVGVERLVAVELEERAVKGVGARLTCFSSSSCTVTRASSCCSLVARSV